MASRQQYMLEILLGAKTASSYHSSIRNAQQGIRSLSSSAKKAAAMITGAFAAVNVTGAIKDAVEVYSGFEQELASSAAIAGATAAEQRKMEQASRDAGKATTKTAQESASALGYMALAGWDVNESTQSLMPVLKTSVATNLDLATTSDLVTDSMSALKLGVKELPGYLDMVVQENNSANTTSEQLMRAFIQTGGAARALKIDAQDTGVALGILANNGTKAEAGGRAMNSMLTRIASNKTALDELAALKINLFEKGEFVGLEEALKRINKGIAGLTTEEKAKSLKSIAGTQYYSKMKYLLDGVKGGAKGAASEWDKLEKKLKNSEGALDKMYGKMTDTLLGATETMQSAFSDAKISFADAFDGELIEVINGFGSGFNSISDSISEFASENEVEIHQTFEAIKEDVLSAGDKIMDFGGFVADNFDAISSGITGIGIAMGTYKVGKGLWDIAKSLSMVTMSPIGILMGVGTAIGGIGTYMIKTHKNAVKANLEEHFGDISLSLEDLDGIAKDIVGRKDLTKISKMLEAIGKTDESIADMTDSLSTMEKINWKVKAGFTIDKDDRETYTQEIKDYMKSAQATLDNQGYTVHIATNLLFGENSSIGAENDAFYSGLDKELRDLKKQLKGRINEAVKKGVSIEKDEMAQQLIKDIGDITNKVTKAQNKTELQAIELEYSGKDLTATDFKQLTESLKKYEQQEVDGAKNAWKTSMNTLNLRLDEGDITEEEYNAKAKKHNQRYYNKKAQAMQNSSKYILNTIQEAYPEAKSAMKTLQKELTEEFENAVAKGISVNSIEGTFDQIVEKVLGESGISGTSQEAIAKFFESGLGEIWSDMEDLETEIQKKGLKVPKSLKKGITDTQSLSALTGSTDDMLILLGKSINESDELSALVSACNEVGGSVPEYIADEIENNSPKVVAATNKLMQLMENSLEGKLNFQITMGMMDSQMSNLSNVSKVSKVTANASYKSRSVPQALLDRSIPRTHKTPFLNGIKDTKSRSVPKIYKNAKGGIYQNPILTTFAEMGPEAAIPLDGTSRAKALWQQAGQMLGMDATEDKTLYNTLSSPSRDREIYNSLVKLVPLPSAPSGSAPNIQITYAPTIEVKGNADERTLAEVSKKSQEDFSGLMDRYFHSNSRVQFNG